MMRGMRLGIWVLRLYLVNSVVWYVWERGVWVFVFMS